jgi:hypothetical protein
MTMMALKWNRITASLILNLCNTKRLTDNTSGFTKGERANEPPRMRRVKCYSYGKMVVLNMLKEMGVK